MSDIIWPERYTPGTTDNFVSNEVIVKGLTVADVWPLLKDASAWPTYYGNVSKISFHSSTGTELSANARFQFTTFIFPVQAEVTEYEPPAPGKPVRLAWRAWINGSPNEALDVLHAWLLEDLPGGRVRILTQESQIGKPAKEMAIAKPNPMLNAHQEWLDGLVRAAQQMKSRK